MPFFMSCSRRSLRLKRSSMSAWMDCPKMVALRHLPGIRSATIFGQSIHALIEDRFNLNDLREQLMKNGITVTEIRPLAPSLEDVFVELTYKHQALLEATRA